MFVYGRFIKSVALVCLGALFACSGGSAESSFPASGTTNAAQGIDPAADAVTASRVTANVISPATTIDKCTLASPCISGTNTSTGPGVFGSSSAGRGVSGATHFNSTSATNGTYGIYGADLSTSGNFDGGVFGVSARGNGVSGVSTSASGVYGKSSSSYGVYGTSGYAGVIGVGNTYGVFGNNSTSTGDGVYGANSAGGNALHGFAPGTGVGAFVEGYFALYARSLNTSGFIILGESSGGTTVFTVDDSGNVTLRGNLLKLLPVAGGASASGYAPSATRPSVEDTGTVRLVNGQAIVRLDPTFARTIDASRPYQVFLTPGADTRGLYVSNKGASSFVVREMQGGHGTFEFDYHIYATALGAAGRHMTIVAPLHVRSFVKQ
jgi:hypothetical protein